jgi:hypothetical protein
MKNIIDYFIKIFKFKHKPHNTENKLCYIDEFPTSQRVPAVILAPYSPYDPLIKPQTIIKPLEELI